MVKLFVIMFSLLTISCTAQNTTTGSYKVKPEDFKCPSDYFALCEGHNQRNMDCQCVEKRYQRDILEALRGL